MNPWLNIPLEVYEAHMALPHVGQAEMLANELIRAVRSLEPRSLALIGSAGGNGLALLNSRELSRVLCVDVNPAYLKALADRYASTIPQLECYASEIEIFVNAERVDMAFCGLIFEYTRLSEALASLSRLICKGGFLCAITQLPAAGISTVSPSPYSQILERVVSSFRYIQLEDLVERADNAGFSLIGNRVITLDSGKEFYSITLQNTGV